MVMIKSCRRLFSKKLRQINIFWIDRYLPQI